MRKLKSIPCCFIVVYKLFRIVSSDKSLLKNKGYFNTFKKGIPLDSKNQPVPWMNYPFVDFLSKRLNKDMVIFEYGSGFSTLYFQNYVKKIRSIEQNKKWFEEISNRVSNNVEINFYGPDHGLDNAKSINFYAEKYDLIIVDAADRFECVRQAIPFLKPEGVLLLDDSQRISYKSIFEFMQGEGYKEITIGGLKPGSFDLNESTIFYKSGNVLNI